MKQRKFILSECCIIRFYRETNSG
uniref:Uncharacterized protein n=1 Tax=Rhizophora mucronata TaxID=61149 RepID=A0A2P2R1F0_RHIMU